MCSNIEGPDPWHRNGRSNVRAPPSRGFTSGHLVFSLPASVGRSSLRKRHERDEPFNHLSGEEAFFHERNIWSSMLERQEGREGVPCQGIEHYNMSITKLPVGLFRPEGSFCSIDFCYSQSLNLYCNSYYPRRWYKKYTIHHGNSTSSSWNPSRNLELSSPLAPHLQRLLDVGCCGPHP